MTNKERADQGEAVAASFALAGAFVAFWQWQLPHDPIYIHAMFAMMFFMGLGRAIYYGRK